MNKLITILLLLYSTLSFSSPNPTFKTDPTLQSEVTLCGIYIDGVPTYSPLVDRACNYTPPKLSVGNHKINATFAYYSLDGVLIESPLSNTIYLSKFTSKPNTIWFSGPGRLCNKTDCTPIE
jgi:hypothetical protein